MPRKIGKHVSELFDLVKFILKGLVTPELLELEGGWQEWEFQFLEDVGMDSVEVIYLGSLIINGFCFAWASD